MNVRKMESFFETVRVDTCGSSSQIRSEGGFVLPYVLVMITIVALLAAFAVRAVSASTSLQIRVTDVSSSGHRLDQAEISLLYEFLTASMVRAGLNLSQSPIDETELALGEPPPEDNLDLDQIWDATGGNRQFVVDEIPVDVTYFDAHGLISLNSANPEIIRAWLVLLGEPSIDAESLTARLKDYTDSDTRRSFRGAERADYRLRQLPPPTNSPLRSPAEISMVLGSRAAPASILSNLSGEVTLFPTGDLPRSAGLSKLLAARLSERQSTREFLVDDDLAEFELVNSQYPSERAQFVLSTSVGATEWVRVRVLEIERLSGAAYFPYSRRLVQERFELRSGVNY